MKKILLTGIVILIAAFFVTCDIFSPEEGKAVEYTNVVYSQDGSEVRLYLDGIGVPKTQAQRAMSLDLAKMAYDYLEVIFESGGTPSVVAIAQWELGQSPTISGVKRGTTMIYQGGTTTPPYAYMAVGTKDAKTLLGIGEILRVGEPNGTETTGTTLTDTAVYVVFGLKSVKTGLLVNGESAGSGTGIAKDITHKSLVFTTPATADSASTRSPLGDSSYPMYPIPAGTTTGKAAYTFYGAAVDYKHALVLTRTAAPLLDIEKRVPRYMDGGRYLIPKSSINTKSKITLDATTYGTAYNNVVTMDFAFSGTGIFSFYIDIPVCLVSRTLVGTNGGQLAVTKWHLRTGYGSELYSLDDGASSGGCALIGIGISSLDWLEIKWEWVN